MSTDVTETVVVEIVFRSANTPPGGMMSDPSNSSTASPEMNGVAVAPCAATRVPKADPVWITKLLVKPVSAVEMLKPFACEPALARVLRLIGIRPVEIAALPVEVAHTNAPGATAELPAMAMLHLAFTSTKFTFEVAGFHTPTIGVVVAVREIVLADSAVAVMPTLKRLPRYVDS